MSDLQQKDPDGGGAKSTPGNGSQHCGPSPSVTRSGARFIPVKSYTPSGPLASPQIIPSNEGILLPSQNSPLIPSNAGILGARPKVPLPAVSSQSSLLPGIATINDIPSIISPGDNTRESRGVSPIFLNSINPLSKSTSKAESMSNLQDIDVDDIFNRLEALKSLDFNQLSSTELGKHHDHVSKMIGDLWVIEQNNPVGIGAAIVTLRSDLEATKQDIMRLKIAKTLGTPLPQGHSSNSPHNENTPKASTIDTSDINMSAEIEKYVKLHRNTLIAEVASCVLAEYTHLATKCNVSKGEIKRSVNSLRGNVNTLYMERQKCDEKTRSLSDQLKQLTTSLNSAALQTNTNFQFFSDQIGELSETITKLQKQVEDLESTRLVTDQSSNNTSERNVTVTPVHLLNQRGDTQSNTQNSHIQQEASQSHTQYSAIHNNVELPPTRFVHDTERRSYAESRHVSDPTHNTTSVQRTQHAQRRAKYVNLNISLIDRLLAISLDSLTKAETLRVVTYDKPKMDGYKKDLRSSQDSLSQDLSDLDLLDKIDSKMLDIHRWEEKLDDLCKLHYLHLSSNKSLLSKVDLKPFDGLPDSDTIYNFRSIFNSLSDTCHSPEEKARLLYESYLSNPIRSEVEHLMPAYNDIMDYLVATYGDIRKIAAQKKRKVASLKHPPNNSQEAVDYYKQVESLLLHCEALSSTPDVNSSEVLNAIHSSEFVESIVSHLPRYFVAQFSRKIELEPRHPPPSGERYFQIFKEMISAEWRHISRFLSLNTVKANPDTKKANTKQTVNVAQDAENANSKKTQKSTQKHMPKLVHPCPCHDDRKVKPHELGLCGLFFKGHNGQRLKLCTDHKVCITCIRKDCYSPTQPCTTVMPEILVCTECKQKNQSSRIPNVFCCPDKSHKRPPYRDVQEALIEYLSVVDFKLVGRFKDQFNIALPMCPVLKADLKSSKPVTGSSPVNEDAPIPAFNSSTGEIAHPLKCISHNDSEDSIYIFQQLNLCGKDVLCFYDSGSTGSLILGPLAESLRFKVIDPESQLIGCLGSNSFYTQFGKYLATLGPDNSNAYHELLFQGISKITNEFPHYDLSSIVSDVKASGFLPDNTIYPESVGGHEVSMLIGVNVPELCPQLLFHLNNGIGVYKMPFADKYNSRIAFGGTHHTITSANKAAGHFAITKLATLFINSMSSPDSPWLDPEFMPVRKQPPLISQMSDHHTAFAATTPVSGQDLTALAPSSVPAVQLYQVPCQKVCGCTDLDSENFDWHSHFSSDLSCDNILLSGSVNKSKIPLAKLREQIDPHEELHNYRCPKCEGCIECKSSDRIKSSSLRERSEQKLIEKSIHIDYSRKKVFVSLPFLADPVPFFREKFHGSSNLRQATAVFMSQCRRSPEDKAKLISVMQELKDLNFIQKVDELPPETKELITNAPFKHFYVWRSVVKDSTTTPCRIVVDPTSTNLNLILPKGDPNLASMYGILMDARANKFCFSSDIRKLYNCLHLLPQAYPYSLFLFNESMNPNEKPHWYMMNVAWYGVICTSSQAATTIRRLGKDHKDSHPHGAKVLSEKVFVDDCLSGSQTSVVRETQIDQMQHILDNGGLQLKYIVKSGEAPPPKASSDGSSVPLLGYTWYPERDKLAISIPEINFAKKRRGAKPANPFPVTDKDSIIKLMLSLPKLTRRLCVAKAAEFYDVLGLCEPFKASLKRALNRLIHLDYDDAIPQEEFVVWQNYLLQWPEIEKLQIPRSCVPEIAALPLTARLICCSDASANCGGAALYLSFLLPDESWSCSLLASKSQLQHNSVPKNELQSLTIAMELVYTAIVSLSITIGDVIVCTDSAISLCWAVNVDGRNKVFVANRVATINRYIDWIQDRLTPGSQVHLAHIPGPVNPSDLLTKGEITASQLSQTWFEGFDWMKCEMSSMPLKFFADLTVSPEDIQEIKKESHDIDLPISPSDTSPSKSFHCIMNGEFGDFYGYIIKAGSQKIKADLSKDLCFALSSSKQAIHPSCLPMINVISLGWKKSNRLMKSVVRYITLVKHITHLSPKTKSHVQETLRAKCNLCIAINALRQSQSSEDGLHSNVAQNNHSITSISSNPAAMSCLIAVEQKVVDQYWNTITSNDCKQRLTHKELQSCFENKDTGVLFYKGRVSSDQGIFAQDLDMLDLKFIDRHSIRFNLPAILPDHPIFYSFAVYCHFCVDPHSGIESTLKEILTRFYPFHSRRILASLFSSCVKCKIIRKKTLEHEMSDHSSYRFTLAPAFCFSMMDLAQPFKAKTRFSGRQTMSVPALVIVCILTGATSLLMMEDWSSSSLILALERHSSRYGVPSVIWVDCGSQMLTLKDLQFDIRTQTDSIKRVTSIEVVVAPPKSHSHQGRVERKILHVRQLLDKMTESNFLLSFLGWETLMAKVANIINSLPICRPSGRSVQIKEYDILTPNRLLLGFNSNRSLSGPMLLNATPSSCLQRSIEVEENFYDLLLKRTHLFIPRSKWNTSDDIFEGDVVLFFFNDSNLKARNTNWHYGRVLSVKGSRLMIEYSGGKKLERSKRQVVRISAEDEICFNSNAHHDKITNSS